MGLITAGKLLLKNKKGAVGAVIDKVAPTLGLEKTGKYKESIKKVLNKAKIKRTQERINTFFKKK